MGNSPTPDPTYNTPPVATDLANDLRVTEEKTGGWVFVKLRDADDGDTFQLGEDEIVSLHGYLTQVIERHYLVPSRIASLQSNELTPELKAEIDAASYETLLRKWRFAEVGSAEFCGERGEYYSKVMFAKRADEPDGGVGASKRVGWDR